MTTKDILNQMEKELYEFIASSPPNYPSVWKSLIRSRLRTLLETFGEEIIPKLKKMPYEVWDFDKHPEGLREAMRDRNVGTTYENNLIAEQRLKVKEIITSSLDK